MAVKDITDLQVCQVVSKAQTDRYSKGVLEPLQEATQQHPKVCWRALERAERRGLTDCGSSLNVAFLTSEGAMLLFSSMESK